MSRALWATMVVLAASGMGEPMTREDDEADRRQRERDADLERRLADHEAGRAERERARLSEGDVDRLATAAARQARRAARRLGDGAVLRHYATRCADAGLTWQQAWLACPLDVAFAGSEMEAMYAEVADAE
jgi:hypothetical protein